MKKKIAILGAGPAGMVSAYELMNHGNIYEIHVYEKNKTVGGMAGSFIYNGQTVDFGPHRFFSKIDKANEIFIKTLGDEAVNVKRLTRMFYNKKFFAYPVKLGDVIKKFSFSDLLRMSWSYLLAKIFPYKNPTTFDKFIINNFGEKLYQTFFKNYTEKLWGIDCSKLGAKRASQRIKGISVISILKQSLFGKRNKGSIKSRVDEFLYPKYGNGYFYEKMKQTLVAKGVQFYLGTPIKTFERKKGNFIVNGIDYEYIISTLPINELLLMDKKTPSEILQELTYLKFRNTILVYATLEKKNIFPDNWIYLHSPNVKAGRLTNFNNRSPYQIKDHSKTYVCLEYRDSNEGVLWNMKDKDLHKIAIEDLKIICEIEEKTISNLETVKIKNSYPIYDSGYEEHLQKIERYLDSIKNLQTIGRAGSFKYNNQDHSMYMGYLASRNLLGEKHNLWEINSDEEYHEEKK